MGIGYSIPHTFREDGGERTVDEVNPAQGNTRIDSTGHSSESILSPERRGAHLPDGRQGARHVLWSMFPPSPPSYIDHRHFVSVELDDAVCEACQKERSGGLEGTQER